MISLLARFFVRDRGNVQNPAVRTAYGMLCGLVGIFLNLILFTFKLLAGTVSGSIAITADAFNNLSDAGSSVVTLLGFRLAGARPDPDHPFGHGRIEYLSGLIVSFVIIYVGIQLGIESIGKITNPEPVEFSPLAMAILAASILVKGYMFLYNRAVGRRMDSAALQATATDSISDSVSTAVVLISSLVGHFAHIAIDAYCGIAVALFILYSGFNAAKDTINPLLGEAPSEEFVEQIREIVLACDCISGIHDLIIHDYGPGRRMISLHAEVPASGDLLELHDAIDVVERKLQEELGCDAVVHMDPIVTDDDDTQEAFAAVLSLLRKIDEKLTIHDFRMVKGQTHTNLIFDVVIPFGYSKTEQELKTEIAHTVHEQNPHWYAVCTVDKAYVIC